MGPELCTFHLMLGMLCTAIPQGSNLLIAIYCYIKCVGNPHFNVSLKLAASTTILVWIIDILLLHTPVILGFIHVNFEKSQMLMCWAANDPNFSKFVLLAIFPTMHLPTIFGVILYVVLMIKIRKRKTQNSNRNEKAAKCMAGLFLILMICLMPNLILRFVEKFVLPPARVRRYSQYILYMYFSLSTIYYIYRVEYIMPPKILKILKTKESSSAVNPTACPKTLDTSDEKFKQEDRGGKKLSVAMNSNIVPESKF